jgi:hypothetical protein
MMMDLQCPWISSTKDKDSRKREREYETDKRSNRACARPAPPYRKMQANRQIHPGVTPRPPASAFPKREARPAPPIAWSKAPKGVQGHPSLHLALVPLVQRLDGDAPQQLAREDAQQRPRQVEGLEDGAVLVRALGVGVGVGVGVG